LTEVSIQVKKSDFACNDIVIIKYVVNMNEQCSETIKIIKIVK
ncbi:hypothetical protein ACJ72_08827, partial [Emergomyces africanus]